MASSQLTAERMESVMRDDYDGCNEADAAKMMRNFTPDGTHYFPPGMYDGPFRGAAKTRTCSAVGAGVAERWQAAVAQFHSYWTIDTLVIDERQAQAVTPHLPCRWGQVSSGRTSRPRKAPCDGEPRWSCSTKTRG